MAQIHMDDRMLIISETDERGIITFANEDFVTMSQYDYNELIGKPHNVLRHPIMPKAAFADLWKHLKSDQIWNGFVCNRTKNNDYYWVYATVAPITTPTGERHYISIRKKPSEEEVKHYTALYQGMRQ
ncbi:MAG: hypothetical protein KU37_11485 [Sulfuricurvum sp. PC08-66]|nr:MAG: hypothetical protein KU37_11485 [Sulfuricurvum sp. PC08-66]